MLKDNKSLNNLKSNFKMIFTVIIILLFNNLILFALLSKKEATTELPNQNENATFGTDMNVNSSKEKSISNVAKEKANPQSTLTIQEEDSDDLEDISKAESILERRTKTLAEIRSEDVEHFAKKGAIEVSVIEPTIGGMIKAKIVTTGEIILIDLVEDSDGKQLKRSKLLFTGLGKDYINSVNIFARDIHNSNKTIWFVEDKSRARKVLARSKIPIHYGFVYESKGMYSFNSIYLRKRAVESRVSLLENKID